MRSRRPVLENAAEVAGHRRLRALVALLLAYALALQPLLMGGAVAHGAPAGFQILCSPDSGGSGGARSGDEGHPAGSAAASCCCLAAIGGPAAAPAPPLALPGAPPFVRLTAPAIANGRGGGAATAHPSARPRAPPAHPDIAQAA